MKKHELCRWGNKGWLIAMVGVAVGTACSPAAPNSAEDTEQKRIELPAPKTKGQVSLEETLAQRRSRRNYSDKALSKQQLAQLLWAGQGITDQRRGLRTAPSAGATFPLELYAATPQGVFRYHSEEHELSKLDDTDRRADIAAAALNQRWMAKAGAIIIIAAHPERTTRRYGERGHRYVYMEAGHVGQNLYLQAVALDLGSVAVGAFEPKALSRVIGGEQAGEPIYTICVGHIAE